MSSYQKNGDTGTNGNDTNGQPSSGGILSGWKKWGVGAALVAILAVVYSVSSGPSPSATKSAIEKEMTNSDLSFDKNGKLKLFDSISKCKITVFAFRESDSMRTGEDL